MCVIWLQDVMTLGLGTSPSLSDKNYSFVRVVNGHNIHVMTGVIFHNDPESMYYSIMSIT